MTGAVVPFDLEAPLPGRLTVLEASAGTGKTFTIEGLVTRYVAEGFPLPKVLVVTFTRAATAELRDRVRSRLVRAADHLERRLAIPGAPLPADPVLRWLSDAPTEVMQERRHLIEQALADFDAATISTIHGFCQHVLGGLGLTGDADRTATLIEDERAIIDAVVDDIYVRRFHDTGPEDPTATLRALTQIASKAVGNPDALILPVGSDDPTAAMRADLAEEIRSEVGRRKRAAGVLSFDDVLTRLADTLENGDTARRRLSQQYSVALIDEFQDTDPVQWKIVWRAFGGDRPLVLIGDPKQAIYAFRGADVHAYLSAANRAATRATLETNWRSDGPLLDAYNALFREAQLGHPQIVYRPVRPAPAHAGARLRDAPVAAPLRLRYLPRHDGLPTKDKQRKLIADPARDHVARDLAAEIVRLLDSDATITETDPDGTQQPAAVRPPHIAVLVRRNVDAARVQRHLRAVNVPAVINGVGSVFETEAAVDWLRFVEALERPASPGRVRAAALTCFFGWSGDDVAAAGDDRWDHLHQRLHRYAAVLRDRSVASLVQRLTVSERLSERLLGMEGGERLLTDVAHIGELLHAVATTEAFGPTALATWLRDQMAQADENALPEEQRARRLESDADAVQVMTIHRSKGLEFPILFCPYAWGGPVIDKDVPVFHDAGRRVIDVGGPTGPDFDDHKDAAEKEQVGEDLRLLYVALTRAKHQTVVWWAPYTDTASLAKLLFCRRGDGTVNTRGRPSSVYDDPTTLGWLHRLADQAPGRIAVEQVPARPSLQRWAGEPAPTAALRTAAFDRTLDHRWRRSSYSSITRHHHDVPAGTEPGEPTKDDEDVPGTAAAAAADPAAGEATAEARLRGVPSPLADAPGGVQFGTFVHAVFEETDFTAPDLDGELRRHVDRQLRRRHLEVGDEATLTTALRAVVETPLGPLAGDVALRAIPPRDRLAELDFELPLVGGSAADRDAAVPVAAIAELLREHVPPEDPLDGYAERLRQLAGASVHAPAGSLRGYLTGSVDGVLRVPGPTGPRFVVVDYKTNWLGVGDEPLSAWHYRPSALAEAMQRAHYPLQALLYTVALHRYLRWRLAGYRPGSHLAGILYLFVRGMTGADVPRIGDSPCGVFSWRPPAELVTGLSDLLDRGRLPGERISP